MANITGEEKEFCYVKKQLCVVVSNGNGKLFLREVKGILNGSSITC